MLKKVFLAALIAAMLLPTLAWAGQFAELKASEVKKLLDSGSKLVMVDARTLKEYNEGHAPEAINIEPEQTRFIAGFLPVDKATALVFYCRGAS